MNILRSLLFLVVVMAVSSTGVAKAGSTNSPSKVTASQVTTKRLTGGIQAAPNPIPDSSKGQAVHQTSIPSRKERYIDTYQNCQEVKNDNLKGVFVPLASRKEWNRFTQTPPPGVSFADCVADPDVAEEIIKDKCANGVVKARTISIHFPNPKKGCRWNEDGNRRARDRYLQGRVEQTQRIDIPDGATLCSAKFNFSEQRFWYDDLFLMTIDNSVVAASNDWASAFEEQKGFLQYDWEKLVGRRSDMRTTNDYCPTDLDDEGNRLPASESLSQCKFPETDRVGKINLKIADNMIKKAMANSSTKTHVVKFITIGDNDASDCQHFDLRFGMDITYAE